MNKIKFIFITLIICLFANVKIQAQGPVLLVGVDTECGGRTNSTTDGLGSHGSVNQWSTIFNNMLTQPCVKGSGILVIGGGKNATDNMTTFWNLVGSSTLITPPHAITYVNGAVGIASQSFSGFRMIAVVNAYCGSGSLSQPELDALNLRASDVASFVNGGGCLFGSTGTPLTSQFGYVAALGSITVTTIGSFFNPTYIPTSAGISFGFPTVSPINGPWHNTFATSPFPVLLKRNFPDSLVLAIGGMCITISPPSAPCCKNTFPFWTNIPVPASYPFTGGTYSIEDFNVHGANTIPITEIRATVESFELISKYDDCLQCYNSPALLGSIIGMGNIGSGINMLQIQSQPYGSISWNTNINEAVWKNPNGVTLNTPDIIRLMYILPPESEIPCCVDSAKVCTRFIYKDVNCGYCEVFNCTTVALRNRNKPASGSGKKSALPTIEELIELGNKPNSTGKVTDKLEKKTGDENNPGNPLNGNSGIFDNSSGAENPKADKDLLKSIYNNTEFLKACEIIANEGDRINADKAKIVRKDKSYQISWNIMESDGSSNVDLKKLVYDFDGEKAVIYFDEKNEAFILKNTPTSSGAKLKWPPSWWPGGGGSGGGGGSSSGFCGFNNWSSWVTTNTYCGYSDICVFNNQQALFRTETRHCKNNPNNVQTRTVKIKCGC